MGDAPADRRLEALRVAARFAWPAAFVAVAAMGFAWLRSRPEDGGRDVRVHASSTVVRSLRDIARLETTSLHVEKVIDVKDRQERLHGLLQGEDALLFVASGEVVVGVDLGKLRDEDVRFDEATKTATVTLPEPEVFSARFDELRSYVHSRDTDIVAKRNEQLESVARREAIAAFEAAGRDKDVTARAKQQAEKELRALAAAWGARAVTVTWRPLVPPEVDLAPKTP
jgi:hypothetical protein